MRFLLRTAFWLTVVALLLPSYPSQRAGSAPALQVSAGEAVSAASAAVADMRQFCSRQPDTCVVGSQALAGLGQKAQAGAKKLYELFTEQFGGASATVEKSGRTVGKPLQNTLSPADLAAPWRGPPRKEAEAKRST
jgi:Family of unknown function (DUF5330)